jgi:hypothetical protein
MMFHKVISCVARKTIYKNDEKATQTVESHKDDLDDDATEKTTTQTKQRRHRKEDEASQTPKDDVSHDDKDQYQPSDPSNNYEYSKNMIKNDTTVMVSNLSTRHKVHGHVWNKRSTNNIKRVRTKSVLSNNSKRGSIDSMNIEIARTQRR